MDEKRLFFGFEVRAPWPERVPKGRTVEEPMRHITVAFLGKISQKRVFDLLDQMPRPPFKVAPVGIFNECLFLPQSGRLNAVAWKGLSIGEDQIALYAQALSQFFREKECFIEPRPFLNHTTIARPPFEQEEWETHFCPLPYQTGAFHLYESVGCLTYRPIWTLSFLSPFDPIDHVADLAFQVRGEEINQLYIHAQIALAFECPELVPYLDRGGKVNALEEVIVKLNEVIARADVEIGIPFKAVSFHGNLIEKNGIFTWEMIVDV